MDLEIHRVGPQYEKLYAMSGLPMPTNEDGCAECMSAIRTPDRAEYAICLSGSRHWYLCSTCLGRLFSPSYVDYFGKDSTSS